MTTHPAIRATRIGAAQSYPMREYVYRGDDPIRPKVIRKPNPDAPPCSIEDCDVQAHARGYCTPHYYSEWKAKR